MNTDDYAIVIGIRRYPLLRPPLPGNPHDLQGPDLDAKEIDDWLADPAGGGVPQDNRLLVTSDLFPDPFETESVAGLKQVAAKPTADHIAGCFTRLINRLEASNQLKLGRRLYVYFAGHGFGMGDCDGGVYTANADPNALRHFYVHSWFDWFYRNAYFEEFVLWMDACSSPVPFGAPNEAPLPQRQVEGFADGRRWVAYAAKHPRKSVERRMPDGQIRGVFTYALLQGLRGAAVDPATGTVTAASLRTYLTGSLESFQPQQDRDNPDIGSVPAIWPAEDIDFGPAAVKTFARVIRFDARHTGHRAVILDGGFRQVAQSVAGVEPWEVALPSGIYEIEVAPDTKLHFEVTGESTDEVIVA